MVKKITLILTLIFLVGCNEGQQITTDYTEVKNANNLEENYRPKHAKYAYKFIFEGHKYILFSNDRYPGKYSVSSTVHDPNCSCFKKKEE